jgi:TonB family protein
MISLSRLALFASLAASSATGHQGAERVIEVPAPEAAAHVIKRAEPIYPASALAAGVEGVVRLRATVVSDGTVRTATLVSGSRLLAPAAIEAVKQWRYTPFTVDGHPVSASFDVEVPFVLPRREERDLEADSLASTAFNGQWEECQRLLGARKSQEATAPCLALPELAEKLPPDRQLERAHAHEAVGMLHFSRAAYAESLAAFQRALAVRQSIARPDDADLGMAYQAVAWGYRMAGNAAEARRNYEIAEMTLRKSLAWVNTLEEKTASSRELHEEFRQRYTRNLQTILTDLISFLKLSGDTDAAAAAQLRLDALNRPR